jgi:inner membrane protein
MPIGYLLHHRGHTHTLVGLLALFGILTAIAMAVRSLSKRDPPPLRRLCVVLVLSLGAHLALDAGNNDGVHPFFPLDNRWYYGDTVFIFEPWLWLMLGAVVMANATTRIARALLGAGLLILPLSTVVLGLVPWESLAIFAALTSAMAWALRDRTAAAKAVLALIFCALFSAGMFGLSRLARAEVRAELALPSSGRVLDVVMTPSPAFPVCWAAIVLQRDDQAGTLVLRRGSLSLVPAWRKADACPLNRFATSGQAGTAGVRFASVDEYHVPLDSLRALTADCWPAAWLRFTRAPVIENGRLFDLRFESAARGRATRPVRTSDNSTMTAFPMVP